MSQGVKGSGGTCKIEDCDKPHWGKGWCLMHYTRWRRYGDPLFVMRPAGQPQSPTCVVCGRKSKAFSLCATHHDEAYRQRRKNEDPEAYAARYRENRRRFIENNPGYEERRKAQHAFPTPRYKRHWTPEEVALLAEYGDKVSTRALAQALGRSENAVRAYRTRQRAQAGLPSEACPQPEQTIQGQCRAETFICWPDSENDPMGLAVSRHSM